jgi:acetyl/propionyl-CoA carboxylase alpha subunit
MKYTVSIADREIEVVVTGDDVKVNGRAIRAHIEPLPGTPMYVLSLDGQLHSVVARNGANEKRGYFDLSTGGYRFAALALDERARAIREIAGGEEKASGPAHLMAPMPGLIVRVNVSAGDQVQAGQGLVVMEAMKMENELRATVAGTVRRVAVNPGSAVEKGALLLEME